MYRRSNDELLSGPNLRLRIGEHVVDTGALRIVTRPDLPRLTSKAVAVLVELVRDAGQTVTRDALLDRVWTGRFPTPDVLTQAIKELRRALADDSKPPQYIETIPKVGYRLIAPVLVLDGPDAGLVAERDLAPPLLDDAPETATANDAVAPPVREEPPRAPPRWPLVAIAIGSVLVAIAAIGVAIFVARKHAAAPAASAAHAAQWKVEDASTLTSNPGPERRPQLSPDGTRIAFSVGDAPGVPSHVVVRSIEPSQLVRISSGAENEALPVWSPDGTRVAFERSRGDGCAIFVASSLGGDEREVDTCRNYNVSYYDWTPDGRSLITAFSSKEGGGDLSLATIDLDSGEKTFLRYQRTERDQDLEPHYSPDGRFIAFRRGVAPYSDLYVMPASGGDVRQVTHIASRIRGHAWTRDGRALVFASNFAGPMALYAVDVSSGELEPLGISPAEYPGAARDADTIAYEIPRTQNQLAEIAIGDGKPRRTIAPSTGSDYAAALSPSGERLVFVSDRSGQYQLWLLDGPDASATPLTNDADRPVFWPRWSADGKRVVAVELDPAAGRRLIEIDVASRRSRVLSKPDESILFGGYGVDPDTYLIAVDAAGRANELVLVTKPGERGETRKVIESGVAFAQPDAASRSIYYTTTAGDGLYRYALDTGESRFVSAHVSSVNTNGWRVVDGRIWFLTGIEVKPIALRELDPATGEERVLGYFDVTLKDVNFSVMPDRKSVLLSQIGTEDTDIGTFTLKRAVTH
jgi:Tol biopolymer transport system component/DNA-binding winged helix-turn-helix (wHTH) protein